jgi:hypothetical protein
LNACAELLGIFAVLGRRFGPVEDGLAFCKTNITVLLRLVGTVHSLLAQRFVSFVVPSLSGFPLKGGRDFMKILAATLIFAGGLYALAANAQAPPDLQKSTKTEASQVPAPIIAPLGVGTAFNAVLTESLDTRKTKAGDLVVAETAEDVSYQRCLIFPKGTQVSGHVVKVTSGGRGHEGSAIFVQFDKATTKDGQEIILNAGIQALAVSAVPPMAAEAKAGSAAAVPQAVPVEDVTTNAATPSGDAQVVSTLYQAPRSTLRTPLVAPAASQGEFTSNGLFSSESKGAFGRPDLKIYTPTSEGSHGTVLLSSKKNLHLDGGTHLLLVVQPPPTAESEAPASSSTDLDPQ